MFHECKVFFRSGTTRERAEEILRGKYDRAKIDNFYADRQIGANVVTFAVTTLPFAEISDPEIIRVETIMTFRNPKNCCEDGGCGCP